MTLDLDKAREIDRARTAGEWRATKLFNGYWRLDEVEEDAPLASLHQGADEQERNAKWIAFASTFVPAVIAELTDLRNQRDNEAGLWNEQHAKQHRINTEQAKEIERLRAALARYEDAEEARDAVEKSIKKLGW